jgi:FkbM family methyltransferase
MAKGGINAFFRLASRAIAGEPGAPSVHWISKNILPPFIYKLICAILHRGDYRKYHSLDEIDTVLSKILTKRGGYYVELGANDGITQSNTAYFEKEREWKGILIEPALNRYLECVRNRSRKNLFYCAACVPFNFDSECVWLEYYDLMTFSVNLEKDLGDIDAHIDSAKRHFRDGVIGVRFPARAATLNELLQNAKAPSRIDLLSLDVEGSEFSVLQGVDHDTYRFDYIVVECRDINRISKYLNNVGYVLHKQLGRRDYLFVDSVAGVRK